MRVQFIGFEVLTAVTMKITIFWDVKQCSFVKVQTFWRNILHPSSGSKDKPDKSPARSRWQTVCLLVTCLVCSLILKIETMCSSKMSNWTTRNYIREVLIFRVQFVNDRILYIILWEISVKLLCPMCMPLLRKKVTIGRTKLGRTRLGIQSILKVPYENVVRRF
jgi:hypothetical protein